MKTPIIPEKILVWLKEHEDEIIDRHGEEVYFRALSGEIPRGELHLLIDDEVKGGQ